MLGGKAIGALAVVAITGLTGAIGVLVENHAATPGVPVPPKPADRPIRPHLTSSDDVRTAELHRVHLAAARRVDCADCHELRATEFLRPTTERCVGCHEAHEPRVHGATDAASCLTCHDFLLPAGATMWAAACESCHAEPQGSHPKITSHTERCTSCHPVHGTAERARCETCHPTQTTRHAGGDAKACLGCHPPHTPAKAARERCIACHVDDTAATRPIARTAIFDGHDRCVQCHDDHGFDKAAVRACRECHRDRPVASGHAACTGCHEPHQAKTQPTAQRCTTCHAGKLVLAANKVAAHADCRSCHDPHAPVARAGERCATCHAKPASHAQGRTCASCHPPHAGSVSGSCDSCHGGARWHGSARCADCHPKHGDKPVADRAFCLGCHATAKGRAPAIATSDGHARCASCHAAAPHQAAAARPACASCHAREAASAPTGHLDCASCHDVHSGQRKPDARCETCHVDRTRTPHVRVAGGCLTCHRPHGPSGRASPPACTQCHAQLPGMHQVAKHATCSDCHRAHAPAVNSREICVRCHTDRRAHEPAAVRCQACHTFGGK